MNYVLAPSMLAADFKCLGQQLRMTEENGAKYLHFDVMDGMFVPNISFGIPVLECVKGLVLQKQSCRISRIQGNNRRGVPGRIQY